MPKKSSPPSRGRLLWAASGGRLWDCEGTEWEDTETELDRGEVALMLRSPEVPVAVSMGAGPLRWLDGDERATVWRREIAPNFYDVPDWKPPPGAAGQLPFHATVWRHGDRRLVLITDFD